MRSDAARARPADRRLPVRPDLDQLTHEADALLRAIRRGEPSALAEVASHLREGLDPARATPAEAQLVLARSYGADNWSRLVLACRLVDAIWRDDAEAVRALVVDQPRLLSEDALVRKSNWGPPMTYAANLGRDRIITLLRELGATDIDSALDRAVLQGKVATARRLYAMGARPPRGAVMGPAETLNGDGFRYLLDELGAAMCDEEGDWRAPVALVLQTYSRNPAGKHRVLELMAERGIPLPDTPPMAVHRGRIDLLEPHLRRDPGLLTRTFAHREIWPPALGCHADESLALHGTPLAGATVLHLCVDYDEHEMARWLLDQGMDPDVRADVDADGFGGHTPLFATVVSYAYNLGVRTDDAVARLLLDRGADPNARASLRKRLRFVDDDATYEYRDVTPLAWGERFHRQEFVSRPAMRLIAERGGTD
ncbi:MAG: ankyrin repeat domain-containing protein [Gemmatimonadota bacterium]|nr:ankyrin repeat domain-containing protein [Gemmatimonadota bacterium]